MAKSRTKTWQASVAAATVLAASGLAGAAAVTQVGDVGWAYNGGQGQDHYSPLTQVTRANVATLKPVWTFPLEAGALQGQPTVIGRTLYATTPGQRLVALDAVTAPRNGCSTRRFPGDSQFGASPAGPMEKPPA